ncbi:hypothetical protein HKBW3S43_00453 [Candidatus Hakubella thermalkaliphila]|uniref:PIN domain-containing protein n=1 Tax=Candidatus Hakubella thermalkaliphila TaxID=2754717 RepID=A0A6V8PRF6_9ACTN|nr:type II toxin-antitoxin system VapC family toxin [Candidatus Hakubella thermalkaliphila]GFP34660.1 hypothetical protein HKBW3S43_00453 [Candidatus Hakubella thermalkaliphila]
MTLMVCVDASVAAKWVLPEIHQEKALALVSDLEEGGIEVIAPPHLPVEVTNAIHKRVYYQALTPEEGKEALRSFEQFQVSIYALPTLYEEALELARAYQRRTVYDSHYVALAKLLSCDLWTADKELYKIFSPQLPFVKWIGDYQIKKEEDDGRETHSKNSDGGENLPGQDPEPVS